MARTSHPESKLQIQCVTWLKYQHPHLAPLFFAVPNGGSRDKREAAIMKAEGITAGVSDLILNIPGGAYTQLDIEMKSGSRQSDAQKRYQRYAQAVGIKYIICKTFESFKEEVTSYLDTVNPVLIQQLKNLYIEEAQAHIEEARKQYQKKCGSLGQASTM